MEREQVNLEELQTTWQQLGNESVMYPMEMSDVGVKIGLERQLFVDDHLIAQSTGTMRQTSRCATRATSSFATRPAGPTARYRPCPGWEPTRSCTSCRRPTDVQLA